MTKCISFEDALEATGYGKFNVAFIFICGLCLFGVNSDAYSIGYLLPSAQCDLNLSTSDKGILTSVSFIGIVCSSHLWGFLSDTRGRKNVIIYTSLISFLCTLIGSFIANFWILVFMRFLSGFFIAGASATIYPYLGEFHSDKYRTIAITFASLFTSLAIIVLPGIAWLVIPQQWDLNIFGIVVYKPWRLFFLLCSLPNIFVAVALLFFPESPKFLLLQGKTQEALNILKSVYAFNSGKKREDFPVAEILNLSDYPEQNIIANRKNLLTSMWYQTIPLFQTPHLYKTLTVCSLQSGIFAISSGLLFWYPEIVNKMAEHERNSPNVSISVCEAISNVQINSNEAVNCFDEVDTSVFEQNLIIGAAYILGTIFIIVVINFLGKRTLLIAFLIISRGNAVALCWMNNRIIVNSLFIGVLSLSGICVFITNAAVVDMFPTYLRAMAVCISLMCGRIGSVVASSIIGILIEINCVVTFLAFAAVAFVCATLSWWIPNFSSSKDESINK